MDHHKRKAFFSSSFLEMGVELLVTLECLFLEKYDGLSRSVAFTQNWMGIKWKWKLILTIFKYKNECYSYNKKIDKKWAHLPRFHVSFQSYGPYIVQKSTFFLQFWADLGKKSNFVKAIYIYSFERYRSHFHKTVLLVMLWLTASEILGCETKEFW